MNAVAKLQQSMQRSWSWVELATLLWHHMFLSAHVVGLIRSLSQIENTANPVKHGFILYSNFLMVNIITPGTVVSQITHIQQWYWRMSKITRLKRRLS